jgi:MFS family permease
VTPRRPVPRIISTSLPSTRPPDAVTRRRDVLYLVAARVVRLFAYGFLSIVLALYLSAVGLSARAIGALLSLTLAGDAGISLWLTVTADRLGRRRTLVIGAVLMAAAGLVFAATHDWYALAVAAVVGVISPSGNEIGPFLAVEQAALTELVPGGRRTRLFAWYQLAGAAATALGALSGGVLAGLLRGHGLAAVDAYRVVLLGYAAGGGVLVVLFLQLSPAVEVEAVGPERPASRFGLHRSQSVVIRLSALFALDAFGGGLVVQSIMAYWLHVRFGIDEAALGAVFFGANLLAAASALAAARIASRIGLVNTMVATHLPSNVLLCLVPAMPTLPLAVAVLLLRFSISQMDVPTRQSYTVAVVAPDERSAAAGITAIARSIGAAFAPALGGMMMAGSLGAPFVASGGLKIVYDLLLYRSFKALRPPEEEAGR